MICSGVDLDNYYANSRIQISTLGIDIIMFFVRNSCRSLVVKQEVTEDSAVNLSMCLF